MTRSHSRTSTRTSTRTRYAYQHKDKNTTVPLLEEELTILVRPCAILPYLPRESTYLTLHSYEYS